MDQKSTEQQQAQNLYFQTELSQTQIATLLNVNRKTLYTWIKEGCWERSKYAAKHVPCILAEQYLAQLGEMNNMIAQRAERPYPTKEEADIMRKVAMTHKNVKQNRKSVSDNIELFVNFTQELRREDYKIAQQFMPYMDKYIQAILKEGHGLNNPWKTYLKESAEDREYEEWLSQQPKAKPLTPTSFPPGYFTCDYQAQEVVAHPEFSGATSTAPSDVISPTAKPALSEVEGDIASPFPTDVTPPAPKPALSEVEEERDGVRSGVTNESENTYNQLITSASIESDNTNLSTKENEQWGEVTSDSVTVNPAELPAELPVTVSPVELPVELPTKTDRWAQFLEENYQISEDPYVTRKNGITVIRRGSPLWGRNSSLFFK